MADTFTFIPGETADRIPTKLQVGLVDTGDTMNGQPIYAVRTEGAGSLTAPATGYAVTRDSTGIERRYSTLTAALAAVTDATSNNRRLVVVNGAITETAPVVAKSYVDVFFKAGSILNCNSTTGGTHGILFNAAVETKWYTDVSRSVEIRRNGVMGSGANRVVEMTAGTGIVFEGIVVRNLVTNINSNRGLNMSGAVGAKFYNCAFYGAGTANAYGAVVDGDSYFYDCEAYGGDTTLGGSGGVVPCGWVINQTTTAKTHLFNCIGYGGNAGTSSEAYGFWLFSYAGQGSSGDGFAYLQDCIGYGGIASAYTDGINGHISATVHLVRCTGISGDNGHGIGIYGTTNNYARFTLDDCTGICRNSNASSTDWHGLSVGATDRSRFNGGTYYGSPFVQNSCGLRLNQDTAKGGSTASDVAIAEFNNVTFYGGGAGMEAQTQTTQQTGCHGLKVVEAEVGARFNDCVFIGNDESSGVQLDATASLTNLFFERGSAYSTDTARIAGFISANAWNPANISDMRILGGMTNVTPIVEYAPREVTLTDGATVTWAFGSDRAKLAVVTLGGNRTLDITGAVSGTSGVLRVVQGAGGNTLALPAGSLVANGGAGAVTLSAGAGDIDVLSFYYNGTNYYWTYGVDFT